VEKLWRCDEEKQEKTGQAAYGLAGGLIMGADTPLAIYGAGTISGRWME